MMQDETRVEVVQGLTQPWADFHGDLPDYDHPLRCVFESGVQCTVELLAKELKVTDWTPCDGTEEYDGDLGGTLINIVLAAMPKDQHGDPVHPRDLPPAFAAPPAGERDYACGVADERARSVAWLKRYAVLNREASEKPCHSASPARTIDLRARAASCNMHATWFELGKHEDPATEEPEPYTDALIRLEAENADWRRKFAEHSIDQLQRAGLAETPLASRPLPADREAIAGEVGRVFRLQWVAAARPPVHPDPMTGRQCFDSFEGAVSFMRKQAQDATFVSLTEIINHEIDRSPDAILALSPTPSSARDGSGA